MNDVVVLRAGEGDGRLEAGLEAAGYAVTVLAIADVVDTPDPELVAVVGPLDRFAWVAVTSSSAARRLSLWKADWPTDVRVAAIGPATAIAVAAAGVRCDVVAAEATARSLAGSIDRGPVLFLAARGARTEFPSALRERQVDVDVVVAYDTVPRALGPAAIDGLRRAAVVVALSPSGLDAVLGLPEGTALLEATALVAVGPTTAAHARQRGHTVAAQAARPDVSAVVDAVRSVQPPPVAAARRDGATIRDRPSRPEK